METPGSQPRLLDAAEAELIANDGHLEIDAAARRAGIAVSLAYHHVGSKSGLLAAVVERYIEPLRGIATGDAIPLNMDWRAREKTRLAAIVDYVFDHPLSPLLAGRLSKSPEVSDSFGACMESLTDIGVRNILQGQAQGVVKADISPTLAIPVILGGIRIAVERAVVKKQRPEREQLVEQIWQLVRGALNLDLSEHQDEVSDELLALSEAISRSYTSPPQTPPQAAKPRLVLVADSEPESIEIDGDFEALVRDGYVILKNIIAPPLCAEIKAEGQALLQASARNGFEAASTQRVFNVFSKTRVTDVLATHTRILGLLDELFRPGYLLSQSQIVNILPGAGSQDLTTHDGFYGLPRPCPPLSAAAIWAIDDFTADNGASVIIPGSHEWDDERAGQMHEAIPVIMPAGSVMVCLGTTWQGDGQNHSNQGRCAITHQYCEAYMRQQENYFLELSKDTVRDLSPKLQALIGYSVYPPFMGMVDGKHPLRALED
ncbi:MAG: phytanoyl-CoA dioxygenase family protein [Pseudomonadota bacterium]